MEPIIRLGSGFNARCQTISEISVNAKKKVVIMFIVKFSIIIAELDIPESVLQMLWCDK